MDPADMLREQNWRTSNTLEQASCATCGTRGAWVASFVLCKRPISRKDRRVATVRHLTTNTDGETLGGKLNGR